MDEAKVSLDHVDESSHSSRSGRILPLNVETKLINKTLTVEQNV